MRALLAVLCVAAAEASVVISSVPCTCQTSAPCQHNSGFACYQALVQPGGGIACPPDTHHCWCPCGASHPCRKDDMCVTMESRFGVNMCPIGAVLCQHESAIVQGQAAVAPTPAPVVSRHGRTKVCKCGGATPCETDVGKTCVAEEVFTRSGGQHARCQAGTQRCHCACADSSRPCQHEEMDICLPTYYDNNGAHRCPSRSHFCDAAKTTPAPTPKPGLSAPRHACVCGGGRPCQHRAAPYKCFAQGHKSATDSTLTCPEHTDKCACDCPADAPCQWFNEAKGQSYCFAKMTDTSTGQLVCEQSTMECKHHMPHTPNPMTDVVHVDTTVISAEDKDCVAQRDSQGNIVWSKWGKCTAHCGSGYQTRYAHVVEVSTGNGTPCSPEKRVCTDDCTTKNCEYSGWTAWSACSQNCGGGYMVQRPIITQQPTRDGQQCPQPRVKQCNVRPCAPDLHCNCNPFGRTLDPDAPPPSANQVTCARIMVNGKPRVKVLHPAENSFFKCAYKAARGCGCCMCHLRSCVDGSFSAWDACTTYWVQADGNKCKCSDPIKPCENEAGRCVEEVGGGACPSGSSRCDAKQHCNCNPDSKEPCEVQHGPRSGTCVAADAKGLCGHGTALSKCGRLLPIRQRQRTVNSKVFLSDPVCPQLIMTEMCGNWASSVSASAPS